jgi:hypothetical protein
VGTYTGGVTRGVQGALLGSSDTDRASRFDGVNDYVQVPDSASLDLGDSLTIEEWVRRNTSGVLGQIVYKGVNGYGLQIAADDRVTFHKPNLAPIARSTVAIPTDGEYHHVVATKNGASTHIYVDGVDVTQLGQNQTIANTTAPLQIGRFYNPSNGNHGNYLDGDLDEVALYTTALSAAQVMNHYEMATNGCTNISGADHATYVPTSTDIGKRLRVVLTTTSDADGVGSAASERTASTVASSGGPLLASGTLTNATGSPASGVTVSLYLWPSPEVEIGDDVDVPRTLVAQSVTDSNGTYQLRSPMTSELQNAADENNGIVNLEVNAQANGLIYLTFLERAFGEPDEATIATGGASLTGASAAWRDTTTDLAPIPSTVVMQTGEAGIYAGAAPPPPCRRIDTLGNRWFRIGEVHSWHGLTDRFEYGTHASSHFEIAIKGEDARWHVGGTVGIGHSTDLTTAHSFTVGGTHVSRSAKAAFRVGRYMCLGGHPMRRAEKWIESIQIQTGVWLYKNMDGRCNKKPEGWRRQITLGPSQIEATWSTQTARAQFWSAAADIGPINVGGRSGWGEYVVSTYASHPGSAQWICGSNARPVDARRIFAGL